MSQEISETAKLLQEQVEDRLEELHDQQRTKLYQRDQLNIELDQIEIQIESYEAIFDQVKEFLETIND